MSKPLLRRFRVVAGCVLVVTLVWLLARSGQGGQEKPDKGTSKPKAKPTRLYFGVGECTRCHTRPDKEDPLALCRCTEVTIWKNHDKHAEAYNVLFSERARQMGKRLQLQKEVHQDESCLHCHSVFVPDQSLVSKVHPVRLEEGVNCVACHGAFKEWISKHADDEQREEWRALPRTTKEDDFGMTDLWDPAKRMKLCASCHIGDAENGKVLSHAMYAAGHPPLPGIELGWFSDEMPRHWQYLREKPKKVQQMLHFDEAEARFEQTKLVLVAGVVAFRETLALLATQAKACATAQDPDKQVLDFAQFDCYACHHELRNPSWRQSRRSPGSPGRPSMRSWPLALVRVALRFQGQDEKELDTRLQPLARAFGERPFGDPGKIASEAGKVLAWTNDLIVPLEKRPYDLQVARKLLDQLATIQESDKPDYDSARQLAWAGMVIYAEMNQMSHNKAKEIWKPLDEQLKLSLPSGKEKSIETDLPLALEKRNSYDPDLFQKNFREFFDKLQHE